MYKVKVIVQPKDQSIPEAAYSKVYYEGTFIPKHEDCEKPKIKEQVTRYLNRLLQGKNPHLSFEFTISTSKIKDDFVVCEDKE